MHGCVCVCVNVCMCVYGCVYARMCAVCVHVCVLLACGSERDIYSLYVVYLTAAYKRRDKSAQRNLHKRMQRL